MRTVNSSKCPDWFWQYARFHNAERGKLNARYLIMENTGQGLGDRLHGAIGMLRLAKALDRVLLLNWVSPFPIEEFFEAAGALNWTRQGIQIQQGPRLNFINLEGWAKPQLLDGSLARINDTFLTIVTNLQLDWTCGGCPRIGSQYSEEAACLWQQMFRPLDSITAAAAAELQQVYPGGLRPYVAAHLRLGGLVGEWGPPGPDRGKAPLENYLAAVRCTAQLAANSSIDLDETPALFITDNHNLRQVIQQGHYRRVVAPTGLPVHTAAGKQSLQEHRRSVVDMVLLGWADCIVTSHSGFSLHAWLYGGAKPCILPWRSCL